MQEVTEISNTLKTTAKELNIPIIALAQLNRNLMSRMGSNGKPVLSDLKDSGSIEQDADIVVFHHFFKLIWYSSHIIRLMSLRRTILCNHSYD